MRLIQDGDTGVTHAWRLNSMFWVPTKCASKINLENG